MKNELILSIYASFVATLVLIWEILKFIIEKKSKIKVKLTYTVIPKLNLFDDKHFLKGYFEVTILNKGHSDIYIDNRYIFEKKTNKTLNFFPVYNFDPTLKFPIIIKPKQSIKENVDVNYVLGLVKEGDDLRIYLTDSLDKKYYSNFLKIDKIHFDYFKS